MGISVCSGIKPESPNQSLKSLVGEETSVEEDSKFDVKHHLETQMSIMSDPRHHQAAQQCLELQDSRVSKKRLV